MLERVADILLPSIEAVALEEMSLQRYYSNGEAVLYLPVIVTNATLYSCVFDPENVDMISGRLSEGDITEEKAIRFRKGLITGFTDEISANNLPDANEQKQRSIWIINSSHLIETLSGFKSSPNLGQGFHANIQDLRCKRDLAAKEKQS